MPGASPGRSLARSQGDTPPCSPNWGAAVLSHDAANRGVKPQRGATDALFSSNDATLISSILVVLCSEMTSTLDYEVRARLYFYLGLHRYWIERWVDLLTVESSSYSLELSGRMKEAFQRVTARSVLENSSSNDHLYNDKVIELANSIDSLLQLILPNEAVREVAD